MTREVRLLRRDEHIEITEPRVGQEALPKTIEVRLYRRTALGETELLERRQYRRDRLIAIPDRSP